MFTLAAKTEPIWNLYIFFFLLEKNRKSVFVQLRLVVSSCSQVEAQNSRLSVVLLLWLQKKKEKIDRKEANEWMEHLMTIFLRWNVTQEQFTPKKNSRLIFLYDFRPTLAILWHLYHDISPLVLITLSFPSSKCNTWRFIVAPLFNLSP